jgi:hypothetical protein
MSIAMSGAASGRISVAVCGVIGVQCVTRTRVRVLVAIYEDRNGNSSDSRYQMHPQSMRESDLAPQSDRSPVRGAQGPVQ